MRKVKINLGPQSYSIRIESNLISKIGEGLGKYDHGIQIGMISDQTVSKLYANSVINSLNQSGFDPLLFVVPDGEASKSLEQTNRLYTQLLESNFRRDSLILALGGGVIGDLAGFVAATFMRGIPFVQVPTTLLAQVDSSVGGKVGINHSLGKNLIGSFYQPKFVLIDPNVLRTLDKREIWAGLGEVVKYGLIWDKTFFDLIENHLSDIADLKDSELMSKTIEICCRIKAKVVERDEKEKNLRRILNFGHTLGHALEAVTNYHYFKHGEAIVYGMRWAAWVSWQKKILSESEFRRIEGLLKRFQVPELPHDITAENLCDKIKIDKKQSVKGLHLVLLEKIGKVRVEQNEELTSYIKGWLNHVGST
jgi:3-dehydroquinate synthase